MRRILYNASDTETFQRIVKTAKNGILEALRPQWITLISADGFWNDTIV